MRKSETEVQSDSPDAKVKVGPGESADNDGELTTEAIVADKQAGEHHHVVHSAEDGREISNTTRSDGK